MYIRNIFLTSALLRWKVLIPAALEKMKRQKNFWSFVKSLKNDTFGINTLRENGILKTDTLDKANICNRQFQSAFTWDSVYGQLVLLPTRTESTRTFSLVNSYYFATRTFSLVNWYFSLVNSYFFFGQLVLFEKITYDMLCYFIMALLVP